MNVYQVHYQLGSSMCSEDGEIEYHGPFKSERLARFYASKMFGAGSECDAGGVNWSWRVCKLKLLELDDALKKINREFKGTIRYVPLTKKDFK